MLEYEGHELEYKGWTITPDPRSKKYVPTFNGEYHTDKIYICKNCGIGVHVNEDDTSYWWYESYDYNKDKEICQRRYHEQRKAQSN